MQSLKALNKITLSLTQINNFDDLVYQSIRQGIDNLGFTRLSIWFLDGETLSGKYRVDYEGGIIDNSYESMMLDPDHPAYEVLVVTKKSKVVRDTQLYNIHLDEIGYGDKLFCPMLDGDKVIGVLYSDTLLDKKPFEDATIGILNLYGATLGVLFNRQRSQQQLEASEADALQLQQLLKKLNAVSTKLAAISNLRDLTYHVVDSALSILEFERVGIWFDVEDKPTHRRGTWGTDLEGNIRNEEHLIEPISDHEATMVTEGDVAVHDLEIVDFDGNFIRNGWTLVGIMWDGTKRIGWLYADNGRTGKPLSKNQLEIFRLYADTVGALCAKRIAEERLRQSEIRYRAITEASSDIIVIINEVAQVTYASPSARYLVDIEPERLIGLTVKDMLHRDDLPLAAKILDDCFKNRTLQTRADEIRVRHMGGHWVHMEAIVTSLLDNPAVNGIVVSCRDITQRRLAEDRSRLAEQERERSWLLRQFLDDVSHDFRTPLSTIGTYAYLLQNGSSDQVVERVEVIQTQIQRLTRLIENMHTIAKLDETSELAMIPTYINSLMETAITNCDLKIQEKHLHVERALHPTLPTILGNPRLLHDAFIHLLTNAIQYCDDGDSITIQTNSTDNTLTVKVTDTGRGIAKEDLPHIFDSLYRADKARNTSNGGGGMGLAITRRIIELHNGVITVDSHVGQGTSISLILPASQILTSTD